MVEVGWLRSLGTDGLATVLEQRPEGCLAPVPRALSSSPSGFGVCVGALIALVPGLRSARSPSTSRPC